MRSLQGLGLSLTFSRFSFGPVLGHVHEKLATVWPQSTQHGHGSAELGVAQADACMLSLDTGCRHGWHCMDTLSCKLYTGDTSQTPSQLINAAALLNPHPHKPDPLCPVN